MGPALPYAVAAKLVHPYRPVIAVEGDGAMQMNGTNALIDVAKHRDRWSDPRFVVLVLDNRDLNQVTSEQRVLAGDPKLEASQVVPDFPYARYAELLGFEGIRVDAPDQVAPAWERALSADRPVVYEAVVDPEVPPLPPHVALDQAKKMATALAKDDPARGRIIRESIKLKAQEPSTAEDIAWRGAAPEEGRLRRRCQRESGRPSGRHGGQRIARVRTTCW